MAKKAIIEVGETVPRSLKFGIIVAIVLFWVQFIRTFLAEYFLPLFEDGMLLADFLMALSATVLGIVFLVAYRKILYKLKKVKV